MISRKQENRIVQHLEFLLDINVFYPVDIGTLGNGHIDFLDGKSGVVNTEISFKSKLSFSSRVIDNIVAPLVINISTSSQNVNIDTGCVTGNWATETRVKDCQEVAVNVLFVIQILANSQYL